MTRNVQQWTTAQKQAVLYDIEQLPDKSVALISGLHGIPESTVLHWAEEAGLMTKRKNNFTTNYGPRKTKPKPPNEIQVLMNKWKRCDIDEKTSTTQY